MYSFFLIPLECILCIWKVKCYCMHRMFHNFWNKIIGHKLRITNDRVKKYIYWNIKRWYFRVCKHLVSLLNQKYQEVLLIYAPKCPPFSWRNGWMCHAKLLITQTHSSWVIEGTEVEKPVALRALKFLKKLKIWLLFGNVLKLNFLLYLAWPILKDWVSYYFFIQKIYSFFVQCRLLYIWFKVSHKAAAVRMHMNHLENHSN